MEILASQDDKYRISMNISQGDAITRMAFKRSTGWRTRCLVTSSKGYALKDHHPDDVNETKSRRQASFFYPF